MPKAILLSITKFFKRSTLLTILWLFTTNINRTGVAWAGCSTNTFVTKSLSHPFPQNCRNTFTPKPYKLGTWYFEIMVTYLYMSRVTWNYLQCSCTYVHCSCNYITVPAPCFIAPVLWFADSSLFQCSITFHHLTWRHMVILSFRCWGTRGTWRDPWTSPRSSREWGSMPCR